MIKKLIKLIHKTKKVDELTRDKFLYQLSYQQQNDYCITHNVTFKQVMNNLN